MLLMEIAAGLLFVRVTTFWPPLLPTVTQFQLTVAGEAVTVAQAFGAERAHPPANSRAASNADRLPERRKTARRTARRFCLSRLRKNEKTQTKEVTARTAIEARMTLPRG